MAYNRYQGNSGRRERIEESSETAELPRATEPPREKKSPGSESLFAGGLDGLLSRLDPGRLETEDLLIAAILWLMYRADGDKELLLVLGLYLLL